MAFKFTPVDPDQYARGFEEEEEARSQEEALAAALAVEPHANLERFRKKRGFTKTEMAEMMAKVAEAMAKVAEPAAVLPRCH